MKETFCILYSSKMFSAACEQHLDSIYVLNCVSFQFQFLNNGCFVHNRLWMTVTRCDMDCFKLTCTTAQNGSEAYMKGMILHKNTL